MTKTTVCINILHKYAEDHDIPVDQITESEAYKSSTLGVAMEYLGLLKDPEIQDYVSARSGVYSIDGTVVTSFRTHLDGLPD